MLIITILLSLVCPTVLCKYNLHKYINTFKARSQTSINKHNLVCRMNVLLWNALYLIPIETDMAEKILLDRIYILFNIHSNNHLVSYFSLMYCYGISTDILHLTLSHAKFQSFRIKC